MTNAVIPEKKQVINDYYVLEKQTKFESFPKLDFQDVDPESPLPNFSNLGELLDYIDTLHEKCCKKNQASKKDLQHFYQISNKMVQSFKEANKQWIEKGQKLSNEGGAFLSGVVKSLDFQRIYSHETISLSEIEELRCQLGVVQLQYGGWWFKPASVKKFLEEYNLFKEKLNFQREYQKFEPAFLDIENTLLQYEKELDLQKKGLQSGDELNFNADYLVEYCGQLKMLVDFSAKTKHEILDEKVRLSFLKQSEAVLSKFRLNLKDYLDLYTKEFSFELNQIEKRLKAPLEANSFKFSPSEIDLIKEAKKYSYLQEQQQKIEKTLLSLKDFIEAKTENVNWLGSIQAWTSTLYFLPIEVYKAVSHPIQTIKRHYAQMQEMEEGRFHHELRLTSSFLLKLNPSITWSQDKILQGNLNQAEVSLNSYENLSKESRSQLKLTQEERVILNESVSRFESRKKEERSPSQKAFLESLEAPVSFSKYSQAKRVFFGAIGLLAIAQCVKHRSPIYQGLQGLSDLNNYRDIVRQQLSPSDLKMIDLEVGRLESFLSVHGHECDNVETFLAQPFLQTFPQIGQFIQGLVQDHRLHSSMNVTEVVEEFKSMRVMQKSFSFIPSLESILRKINQKVYHAKKNFLEFTLSLPDRTYPSFLSTFLWNAKTKISSFFSAKYSEELEEETIKYTRYHHVISDQEQKQVQEAIHNIYDQIKGGSYLGLSQKEVQSIEQSFETIHTIYASFQMQSHEYPQVGHLDNLSNNLDKKLSDRELAHIVGDPIAANSGLEGYFSTNMVEKIVEFLKIQQKLNQPYFPVDHLLKTFERSLDFHKSFYIEENRICDPTPYNSTNKVCFTPDQKERFSKLSNILKTHLDQLEIGEPLIILGGWAGSEEDGAGHAISYEVFKQADGMFKVRLSNRGGGVNYHIGYLDDGREKIVPYIEKNNVPIEDLTDPVFVTALYEMNMLNLNLNSHTPGYRVWSPEHIYKALISDEILTGDFDVHAEASDWVEPQISGTCVYQSLAQTVRNLITKKQFDRFEVELGYWALLSAFSKSEEITGAWQDLLSKALYSFASTLDLKMERNPDVFDSKELLKISSKLVELKKHLKQVDLNQKDEKSHLTGQMGSEVNAQGLDDTVFLIPITNSIANTQVTNFESKSYLLEIDLKQTSASFLVTNLSKIAGKIDQYLNYSKEAKQYILEFIDELTKKISEFDYSSLSVDKKESLIKVLCNLSKSLFFLQSEVDEAQSILPKRYLPVLRINQILYQLVDKKMADKLHLEYPLNFLFMGVDKMKMPHFTPSDPKVDQELDDFFQKNIKALEEIPILFPYRERQHLTTKGQKINSATDVTEPLREKDFLFTHFLPSYSKHIQEKTGCSTNALWENVGYSLMMSDHNKPKSRFFYSKDAPEIWNLLINQAILMNLFSEGYLPDEFRTISVGPKSCRDYLISDLFKIRSIPLGRAFFSDRTTDYVIEATSGSNDADNAIRHYPNTNRERVNQALVWRNLGGHLFEQNFLPIEDPSLKYIIEYWQAHLHNDSKDRFELKKDILYSGKFQDNIYYKIDQKDTSAKAEPIEVSAPEGASKDDILELALIIEEPKLRIQRALAFFKNPVYAEYISEKDYQTFFYLTLFSGQELLNQFKQKEDGKVLAQSIVDFLKKGIHKNEIARNFQTISFLLHLNRKIAHYYQVAQPNDRNSPFLNGEEVLDALLEWKDLSSVHLFYLHRERAATLSQKPSLSEEEIIKLLHSYFFYQADKKMAESDEEYEFRRDLLLDQEIYHHMVEKKDFLHQHLRNPSSYLNAVMQKFGYDFTGKEVWRISQNGFPYFTCEEKGVNCDILGGKIHFKNQGEISVTLPYEYVSNHIYKRLFQGKIFSAVKGVVNGNDVYYFVDDRGNSYRTTIARSRNSYGIITNQFILERKIDKKYLPYVRPEELNGKGRYSSQKMGNLNFITGVSHWGKYDFYFYDIETDKLLLEAKSKDGKHAFSDPSTYFFLKDPKKASINFINQFESPYFINLFVSSDQSKIQSIEMPRLIASDGKPLKFVRNKFRLECLNFPGLYLSKRYEPFFKGKFNAIVLENESGKYEKVLMTPYLLDKDSEKSYKTSLDTDYTLDFKESEIDSKFKLNEYKVEQNLKALDDPLEEKFILKPESSIANMYLAFSYLRLHDYEKAEKLLNSIRSSFVPLSSDELSLLFSIITLSNKNKDEDPRGASVRLLASYLYLDHLSRFDIDISNSFKIEIHKAISALYEKYLEVRPHVNLFEANPYHEFQILDYVIPSKQILSRKVELLKEVKYEKGGAMFKPASGTLYLPDFGPRKINLVRALTAFEQMFFGSDIRKVLDKSFVSVDNFVNELRKTISIPFFSHATLSEKSHSIKPSFIAPAGDDFLNQFAALYRYAKDYQSLKAKGELTFDLFKLQVFLDVYKSGEEIKSSQSLMRGLSDFLYLVAQYPNLFPKTEVIEGYVQLSHAIERGRWGNREQKIDLKHVDLIFGKVVDPVVLTFDMILSMLAASLAETSQEILMSLVDNGFYSLIDLSSLARKPIQVEVPLKPEPGVEEDKPSFPLLLLKDYSPKSQEPFLSLIDNAITLMSEDISLETQSIIKSLESITQKNLDEDFEKVAFSEIDQDVDIHGKRNQLSNSYRVKGFNDWSKDLKTLREQMKNQKEILKALKNQILEIANTPDESHKEAIKNIKVAADDAKRLGLDDLFLIFMHQDPNLYYNANPALTFEQITELNSKVHKYLVESTFLQQMQRVEKVMQSHDNNILDTKAVQKLGNFAFGKRAYDSTQEPAYLVFEYYAQILLYSKQIIKLKELENAVKNKQDPKELGLIIEAIMGFGKSKVLLPLLSLHFSSKGVLPILVMPEALIASLGSEIKETVDDFNQKLKVIEFTRASECTADKLENLNMLLTAAIENKEALIFSSTSLQSMYLKFIELLYYAKPTQAEDLEAIKEFQKIFRTLKKASLPIFDEADLLFNCRQETHFTLAASTKLSGAHLDISTLIYEIITSDEVTKKYNFNFLNFDPKANAFNLQNYNSEIKPYLANQILKKLLDDLDPRFKGVAMSKFISEMTKEKRSILYRYLTGESSKETEELIHSMEDAQIANIISLAQAQLNIFLPLTLGKRILEHYGPPKLENKVLAIPYHHGEPNVKSEFGNQYEVVDYTMQYYLKEGVSIDLVKKELKSLRSEAMEMLRRYPSLQLEQIIAFQRLKELYPKASGFELNEKELEEMREHINSSYKFKIEMIRKYFLPLVQIYKHRLSSNPQTFKHLFDTLLGFTGTMWNAETFPTGLETKKAVGIHGNTLFQFVKNSNKEIKVIENEEKILEALPELIKDTNTRAFIDLNGFFDFIPKEKVAREIFKIVQGKGLKGVAYYNDDDKLMLIIDQQKEPIAFVGSELEKAPEKRFTLYDHQRTTGADVSQAPLARATLSIGKHTTLRDLAQAAWRMRGLDTGQAVDFVISEEDKQFILLELDLKPDQVLTIENIISYAIQNQLKIKADDNLLSQKQKIHAVFERYALERLFNTDLDPQEVKKLFTDYQSLFIQDVIDEPRLQYQKAEQLIDTKEHLKKYKEKLVSKYRLFFSEYEWELIERDIEQSVDLKVLPAQVKSSDNEEGAELGQQLLVKTEIQQMLEVEKELETKKVVQNFDEGCRVSKIKWSDALFRWSFRAINPTSFLPKLNENSKGMRNGMTGYNYLNVVNLRNYLPQFLQFISPKIAATSNLFPSFNSFSIERLFKGQLHSLYGSCQNPCQEVLCIDTEEDGLRLLMLDIHEAAEWKEYIEKNDQKNSLTMSRPLFMTNLYTGEIERSTVPSESQKIKDIQNSEEYKDLILQTKLFSGLIYLNEKELSRVESWIDQGLVTKQALKDLIAKYVLSQRPTTLVEFEGSPLGKMLSGMLYSQIRV